MNLTKIKSLNKKAISILYSKWIIYLVTGLMIGVFAWSCVAFFFNGGSINNKTYIEWKATNYSYVIYIWFISSLIASLVGVLGDIYLHRNDKKCFYFYFAFVFSYIISCIVLFLWFEIFEEVVIFFILLVSYFNWGKKKASDEKSLIKVQRWSLTFLYLLFLIISVLVFGNLMNRLSKDTIFYDSVPYLDALIAFSFIAGWILLIKKYIQAYLFFLISTIALTVLSIEFHIWVYLLSNIFYILLYLLGINNWLEIYYEKKEYAS